jgi:hypothetical protein
MSCRNKSQELRKDAAVLTICLGIPHNLFPVCRVGLFAMIFCSVNDVEIFLVRSVQCVSSPMAVAVKRIHAQFDQSMFSFWRSLFICKIGNLRIHKERFAEMWMAFAHICSLDRRFY